MGVEGRAREGEIWPEGWRLLTSALDYEMSMGAGGGKDKQCPKENLRNAYVLGKNREGDREGERSISRGRRGIQRAKCFRDKELEL